MLSYNTTFVCNLSYRSVSGVVLMVDFSPYNFMCRCTIVLFVDFSICFFINPSVRSVHVLRKPFLISLIRIVDFGINSVAWKYCANSGLVIWDRILFTAGFDYCVIRVNSHIPVCLFLVPFNICYLLFWAVIYCWYSGVVPPSSYRTPNCMSGNLNFFRVNVNLYRFSI